ncbi:MAG: protein kinase [Planctomycetes bacterium]|nr:protein kinase [Planctomycetota bacterium]
MPTKTIGEFELYEDRLIGKGAWGEVYHGRQKSLDRPVAIKILKSDLTQDAEFVSRFKREAEILAKITDDHIIHVYSAGQHEGAYYFIMEYVEGKPLSSFVDSGYKFSTDEIIYVAQSVAQALNAAWESAAKIIHRDIKPSNIMVAHSASVVKSAGDGAISILAGKIKVMDFGLAKLSAGGKDATIAGTIIGTPKYISPEQGMGKTADIRSDIYSLGIVLYEMATGRIPFEGETAVSMIRHHIYDTVAVPSQFNKDIPKELEDIIMKCVHKDPDSRYATPAQMLEDLNGFKQKSGLIHAKNATLDATIVSGAVRRKQTARNLAYATIALVLFLAGGFIFYKNQTSAGPIAKNDQTELTGKIGAPGGTGVIVDSPTDQTVPAVDEKFAIKVWVNDGKAATYKQGDDLKFHFRANKDCSIYLYHRDGAGTVKMLFPNPYSSDNKIKGGQVYTIPDSKMNFGITVTPPFGTETVWAVASLQPMTEMDIQAGEKDFRDLGKLASLGESELVTRSLELVPKQARAEDTCTISTTEK